MAAERYRFAAVAFASQNHFHCSIAKPHLPLFGALLLAVLLGYLIGRITTVRLSLPDAPLTLREDTRPTVPVVQIQGIRDGQLSGVIQGEVRVFLDGAQILSGEDGSFHAAAGPLLTNEVRVVVPPGSRFVASSRGSKYYPVDSSRGAQIVPENRVYFASAEEAEQAGFEAAE